MSICSKGCADGMLLDCRLGNIDGIAVGVAIGENDGSDDGLWSINTKINKKKFTTMIYHVFLAFMFCVCVYLSKGKLYIK